jgi:hypothetical protein
MEALSSSGLITSDVTSRAPTGWLSDKATECLSLSVGSQEVERFGDLFLDMYTNPQNMYNPCEGILINSKVSNAASTQDSYARYWHGHAVITQWLVIFIGLPTLRNILWGLNLILLIFIAFGTITNSRSRKFTGIGISFVIPYFLLSDLADLHTSITHVYASIFVLSTLLIFFKIFEDSWGRQIKVGFTLGSLYCFVLYGLSPQSVPVIIISWGALYYLISGVSIRKVFKTTILFLAGWSLGYSLTFVTKWILVGVFTNFDIWGNVRNQIIYRSSQEGFNFSDGVGRHLEFSQSWPAFLQSWVANISTFAIHIIDPRYASFLLTSIVSISLLIIFFYSIKLATSVAINGSSRLNCIMLTNLVSLFFVLFWYGVLAQHSFDHTTYTYRSLVICAGGFLATLNLIRNSNYNMK